MTAIELSAATTEHEDSRYEGPTVVLVHRLMTDASLRDGAMAFGDSGAAPGGGRGLG
jgi:hypothetical protein